MAQTCWINVYEVGLGRSLSSREIAVKLVSYMREEYGVRTLYRIKVTMKEPTSG